MARKRIPSPEWSCQLPRKPQPGVDRGWDARRGKSSTIQSLRRSDSKNAGRVPDTSAQAALDQYRADLRPLLQDGNSIQTEPDRALWWTYAGGQINQTLKYRLQFHHDWKIVADNFRLKIEGDSVSSTTQSLAIAHLSDDAFWNEPSTKRFICEQLPEYRLSKFQQALPESYSLEMISDYLLDIPGAVLFLQ